MSAEHVEPLARLIEPNGRSRALWISRLSPLALTWATLVVDLTGARLGVLNRSVMKMYSEEQRTGHQRRMSAVVDIFMEDKEKSLRLPTWQGNTI
ncbi:hypothetical protein G114_03192 [Aeromonas diversa CDC 2478-85]|uniref:Uncharacterized protein n=1 Tax=Aeromonas diversa CDC 2478-85 TaxID=1268237 RepID=N9VDJ0_9GAMM|nr:hypothetical protein G114_03192 [Aeromonas diversa CDC 2478-85]